MVATASDDIITGNSRDLTGSYMYLSNANGLYQSGWSLYAFTSGC